MADKDYAPLSTACVRALNDRSGLSKSFSSLFIFQPLRMYEKRKAAALEIEKMVKDFVSVGNTSQIKKLLKVPQQIQIYKYKYKSYKYKYNCLCWGLGAPAFHKIILFLHHAWTFYNAGAWKRVCNQSKSSHAERRVDRFVLTLRRVTKLMSVKL